jgi:hypothetical protein
MQIKKVILEDEQGNQIPATFETKDGVLIVTPNRGCGIPGSFGGFRVQWNGRLESVSEDGWHKNHGVYTSPKRAEWFMKCIPYLDQCYKAFVGEVKDGWCHSLTYNFHTEEWVYIGDKMMSRSPYIYSFPTHQMAKQFFETHEEMLNKIRHAVIF